MHHATLYFTEADLPHITEENVTDVLTERHEVFGISEARAIVHQAYMTPTAGRLRAMVIIAQSLTHEAQNALLKILEEPPQSTQFHLVVSRPQSLLPTLLSRCVIVGAARAGSTEVARVFMASSYVERLSSIAERLAAKDTEWQEALIDGLSELARERKLSTSATREFLLVEQALRGAGASSKMLLEHLALTLES